MKLYAVLASLGAALVLGACSTADPGLHRHGPRGAPMADSAMPAPPPECPHEGGAHDMPGPRAGTMPDAAHPGCPGDAADEQPTP